MREILATTCKAPQEDEPRQLFVGVPSELAVSYTYALSSSCFRSCPSVHQ
jgi:hypothetical protein